MFDINPDCYVRGTSGVVDGVTEQPPVRRILVFVIVALALLMMAVDSTIVATALHSLQVGLDTSINWAGWTITAYSLGFVLMLPISGKLSEYYGCRRVFLGSVVAFTAASLLCGFAQNIYVLIALRAVQAIGGAGITPSATGIVVDHFGDARDRAVSLFGSIFPIGAMIGPIFGGLFVSHWSWRGVFFVNVPIGIAIIALALRHVPRDPLRKKSVPLEMDVIGMTFLGVWLLAGMLSASQLGERSGPLWFPAFVILATTSIIAMGMFFRHIRRYAYPFIEPQLIHGPGFGSVNLINVIYGGVTNGAMTLLPLYAASHYAIDALRSGTLLVAQGVAAIVFSLIAALMLRRTGHRPPLYVGGAVMALGILLFAFRPGFGTSAYFWLAASAALVGVGRGIINPASRNAGLQLAPEHSSTLAALRTASLQIGSITTVSVVTATLERFRDPGSAQVWIYAAVATLLFCTLPLISYVPEHHGSW